MKITLIHGEDAPASRKKFGELLATAKSRRWQIRRLDVGKSLSEQIINDSLFAEKTLYVIENFNKITPTDAKWLSSKSEKLDIFLLLYSPATLPAKLLQSLPKSARVQIFDIPKLLFTFLAYIYPGNSERAIKTLHEIKKNEPIELIFSVLAGYIRDLYWVKSDAASLPYPSWRVQKLRAQADKFSLGVLRKLTTKLAAIDIQSKTSSANLASSLDLALIEQLK